MVCESEEEIRVFLERYYPDFVDNLDLGKILCKKWHERKTKYRVNSRNNEIKIVDLINYNKGERVIIKGVVNRVNKKISKRKKLTIYELEVEDETGVVMVGYFGDKLDASDLDVVRVIGKLNFYNGKPEVRAWEIVTVARPKIEEQVKEKKDAGSDVAVENSSVGFDKECVDKVKGIVAETGEMVLEDFLVAMERCGVSESDIEKLPFKAFKDKYGRVWVRVVDSE